MKHMQEVFTSIFHRNWLFLHGIASKNNEITNYIVNKTIKSKLELYTKEGAGWFIIKLVK